MKMDNTVHHVSELLDRPEIQGLLDMVFYAGWLLLASIVIIMVLHSLFELTGSSILYKNHIPQANWKQQFYPAVMLLLGMVGIVMWVLDNLRNGIVVWSL